MQLQMSADARALAESNLRLAEWCARKWGSRYQGCREFAIDDWYSIAYYGLCKAAVSFDETRGVQFATYAARCIYNELSMAIRTVNSKTRRRYNVVSADVVINEDGDTLLDMVSDPRPDNDPSVACEDAEFETALAKALEVCSPHGSYVESVPAWVAGAATQAQIAQAYGISQGAVSKRFSRILCKTGKVLAQGGWVQ